VALRILFEDDDLIVLDKPAGVLAVPLDQLDAAPSIPRGLHHVRPLAYMASRYKRSTAKITKVTKSTNSKEGIRDLRILRDLRG
jgi:23S rRNA-/tRNA-specific pseudouridylate synthase